jgi:hypothetical protein
MVHMVGQGARPKKGDFFVNYIKRLESERAEAVAKVEARDAAIAELRSYLLSSKFHEDPTVQVRDVLTRLEDGIRFEEDARGVA